jgi:putative ABC transport system permease protein
VFGYYIHLALLSLRRSAVLTALMIVAIGVGIGASMTTLTVFRAMSGDPIPQKSHQLFAVQIDSRGPNKSNLDHQKSDTLETSVNYIDAMAWMKARRAKHQTALYATSLSVRPDDPRQKPFKSYVRPVYTDFFPMFDVPFQYGNPWTADDDETRAPVVVISHAINDRLFGGADSVGKPIRLDGETYTVAGVLREWGPTPRFYDLRSGHFGDSDEIFLPFTRAIEHHMTIEGSISCTDDEKAGFANILTSDCIWLQFWVELPTATDAASYRAFLAGYAAEQRRIGRYAWPPQTRLRDVMQWLAYRQVVPNEVNILVLVSFGFLLVCLLNATGLMLAKLMGRAGDFGVRRALGASRGAIVCQCLIETGVVGLAGGGLGLALTGLGLLAARSLLDKEFATVTHLDTADVAIAVLLAVSATLLAGVYPTWRAARVQPGWQLKAQ